MLIKLNYFSSNIVNTNKILLHLQMAGNLFIC